MTKMEKIATVVALLECAFIGYFKYKASKAITEKAERYFEKEAKRVAARQRQKFYKNATESDETRGPFGGFWFWWNPREKNIPFYEEKELNARLSLFDFLQKGA